MHIWTHTYGICAQQIHNLFLLLLLYEQWTYVASFLCWKIYVIFKAPDKSLLWKLQKYHQTSLHY